MTTVQTVVGLAQKEGVEALIEIGAIECVTIDGYRVVFHGGNRSGYEIIRMTTAADQMVARAINEADAKLGSRYLAGFQVVRKLMVEAADQLPFLPPEATTDNDISHPQSNRRTRKTKTSQDSDEKQDNEEQTDEAHEQESDPDRDAA